MMEVNHDRCWEHSLTRGQQTNLAVRKNTGEDILISCLVSGMDSRSVICLSHFLSTTGVISHLSWSDLPFCLDIDRSHPFALLFSAVTHGIAELGDMDKGLDVPG